MNMRAKNSISTLLQLVGGKWKVLIIQALLKKEMRFVELKKELGCTAKVLATSLKELEKDGLVIREQYDTQPPKVEYFLTDIGYTLKSVIDEMSKWGREYKKLQRLREKYKLSS